MSVCQIVSRPSFSMPTRHKSRQQKQLPDLLRNGKGWKMGKTPRGYGSVLCISVCCAKGHQRCQDDSDGDVPMMPGAGPSGRRSATACCCAGLCWLGIYGWGAKVESIISTNNIQQLCGWFVAGGTKKRHRLMGWDLSPKLSQAQAAAAAEQARHQLFTLNFTSQQWKWKKLNKTNQSKPLAASGGGWFLFP